MFVRGMLEYDSELKDEVYEEIRQWNRANVGEGKSFPKSFLFPRSTAPFELMRIQAEEGLQSVADREKGWKNMPGKRENRLKKRLSHDHVTGTGSPALVCKILFIRRLSVGCLAWIRTMTK
jgi:hypothetical protein